MEAINAITSEVVGDKRKRDVDLSVGCPWFIASAEHHYCFWSYAQTIDHDPVPDKEICDLLLIQPATLERIFDGAVARLEAIKDTEVIVQFQEAVAMAVENQHLDYTVYMPEEFRDVIKGQGLVEAAVAEEPEPKPEKKKVPSGLPQHRDGRKTDLYGLYSRRALETRKGKTERIQADEPQEKEKRDEKARKKRKSDKKP